MDNYRGFDAPVMLFLHCSRIMGPPQWSDMGMWLQSVMLLLVEHGLASCPQECRSEEHTSELQSLMRIPYAVLCLKNTKHELQKIDAFSEYNNTPNKLDHNIT